MQKATNAYWAQFLPSFLPKARPAALLIIHEAGSAMSQKGSKLVKEFVYVN